MMKPTRLLAVAAAIHVTVGVGRASAQTLIVRHAPIGSTVELMVNSTKAGTAQADAAGDVRIPINLPAHISKSEIDARVYVDVCDSLRRVLVVERNTAPPPSETDCARQEITGIFEVRRVSTLVVNAAGPVATLLLRQGPYSLRPPTAWRLAPKGLVVFGGGGFAKYPSALEFGCEGVTTCAGDDSGAAYTGGAEYWFTRYIAAEGGYFKPPELTVTGSGTGYRFNSSLDPHVVTIAGKVGVPIGPVRLYAKAGVN